MVPDMTTKTLEATLLQSNFSLRDMLFIKNCMSDFFQKCFGKTFGT